MIGLSALAAAAAFVPPTGRELYVGCYLVIQGQDVPKSTGPSPENFSADACLMVMAIAAEREAAKPPALRTFCIPGVIVAQPYRDMALAYLDYYEKTDAKLFDQNGISVTMSALRSKWRCVR
jgi:hypothetical protein